MEARYIVTTPFSHMPAILSSRKALFNDIAQLSKIKNRIERKLNKVK
jgi:hypothetical protein